jgi:hypothetical protein
MSKSTRADAQVQKSTARRSYKTRNGELHPYWELPFNFFPKRGGSYKTISHWRVPPTDDYGVGCLVGREYAAHFVQYLKDNPSSAGSNFLGLIAKDIDFADESGAKGYWVGFFSQLERIIYMGSVAVNVFDDVDDRNARQRAIQAACDMEDAGVSHE